MLKVERLLGGKEAESCTSFDVKMYLRCPSCGEIDKIRAIPEGDQILCRCGACRTYYSVVSCTSNLS